MNLPMHCACNVLVYRRQNTKSIYTEPPPSTHRTRTESRLLSCLESTSKGRLASGQFDFCACENHLLGAASERCAALHSSLGRWPVEACTIM